MNRIAHFNRLLMLILLIAVGQMAQTIWIPVITDMAQHFYVRAGEVQHVMAAYLVTYGASQLIYGPIADRIGRRPVIMTGMTLFMLATMLALVSPNLTLLIAASAFQGLGTGVGGVMARTMPRDLYNGPMLCKANSLLNMGILVSPLLAPMIGGMLGMVWGWRACYVFLLIFSAIVTFSMARWMPETRPESPVPTRLLINYRTLLGNTTFMCYLLMLISAMMGIVVFETCAGVLLGACLRLNSVDISILFILPIPAAFFGAWYAGRQHKCFTTQMWLGVLSCLIAGLFMWLPFWFNLMTVWTLLLPAALYFFGAGVLFPLATSGAMEPFPFLAGTSGSLIGGLQNAGAGLMAWVSAILPVRGQGSAGLLMTVSGSIILLCWLLLLMTDEKRHKKRSTPP